MLLYFDDGGGDEVAVKYVNEALMRENLTIYMPANTDDNNNTNISCTSKIASKIMNYEDKVNRGNLLALDVGSFYSFALYGNL
jgi:hypothetical protein